MSLFHRSHRSFAARGMWGFFVLVMVIAVTIMGFIVPLVQAMPDRTNSITQPYIYEWDVRLSLLNQIQRCHRTTDASAGAVGCATAQRVI